MSERANWLNSSEISGQKWDAMSVENCVETVNHTRQ